MSGRTTIKTDEKNKKNNLLKNLFLNKSTKNNKNIYSDYYLIIPKTGDYFISFLILKIVNIWSFNYLKLERRRKIQRRLQQFLASFIFTNLFVFQLLFVLFTTLINSVTLAQQNNRVQVQGIADPSTQLQQLLTTPQNPGIISRVSQSGLNLLADYLRVRVLRFTRTNALQYNFSVPLSSHNIEVSINSLDTMNFDTAAFQSWLGVNSNKELLWIGSEFRAAINTQIQLKMLVEHRELFATQKVPLRLEKVRIELILGPAVNADGHLRTDIIQCRIVSGELLFENLFRDAANLSVFVPLVHQVTLTKLSEMICPIFVAELGPVIANRLLNSPLSTALFDHYFLNVGLTSGILYQQSPTDSPNTTTIITNSNTDLNNSSIILFHRGNVFGILRQGKTRINDFRLPFTAPPIFPNLIGGLATGKKGFKHKIMSSFQLSNYTFASLFFWMDQYRKFDYEISQSTIKDPEVAGYLRTECGAKEICAGTLFPALSKNFPNGVVAIRTRTSSFPTVLFQRGRGIVLVESRIDAFVNYSSQQQNRRFLSANMHARLNLQNATFLDYLFRAELAIDTFDISNVVSMVDGIDAGSIEFLVNALNELIIAEDMKRKLQDGIRIPVLLDFEQTGPGFIRFEEGQLFLGADFCFEENCIKSEKSLLMTAESQQSLDMDANYYDISA